MLCEHMAVESFQAGKALLGAMWVPTVIARARAGLVGFNLQVLQACKNWLLRRLPVGVQDDLSQHLRDVRWHQKQLSGGGNVLGLLLQDSQELWEKHHQEVEEGQIWLEKLLRCQDNEGGGHCEVPMRWNACGQKFEVLASGRVRLRTNVMRQR